jgi:hypothetical protein
VSAEGITIIIAEKWSEQSIFSGKNQGVNSTAKKTSPSSPDIPGRLGTEAGKINVPASFPRDSQAGAGPRYGPGKCPDPEGFTFAGGHLASCRRYAPNIRHGKFFFTVP